MHGRGEKKGDSYLFEAGGDLRRRQVNVHTQSFHHVGGAALRGDTAIAVFRDTHAGASDDEGGCSRNVEGSAGSAAGAAGIDEGIAAGSTGVENGVGTEFKRRGGGADGFGESYNFFDGLALHVQRYEQRGNLGVGALAGKHFGHHGAGFFAGERLAVIGDAVERVENHWRRIRGRRSVVEQH